MPLATGDTLGPYEIVAPIGKGGMGEVYRAHDPRTGRDVAIKISAERFSERFDREVRAVAALNHPNVCTLFDVGPNYLVMELVEGESPEGPLPLEEALRIARQIADALEAAHDKGITHRDLKPGNIKVKPDGTVKVLDFGLAKMAPAESGAAATENSPTLSMAATQAGVILGTAAYMAPEQAKGKPVDKRADIWAFGVVLYELLSGDRLFQQDDVTETLAAVVMKAPDLARAPVEVRRLLKKCLEKDPKKRLRDIGDVWELLEEAKASSEPTTAATPSRLGSRSAWIAAAASVLVAAALGVALWRASRSVEKPLVRLDVDLGADVSLPPQATTGGTYQISPDGTCLAYTSGNPPKLFIRSLNQPKANEMAGTSGAIDPFFSPDGQWVGFFANNKLNKISVEGGAVVPLGEVSISVGGAWGEDDNIIVGEALTKGLVRFPAGGGMPTNLTELASGEIFHAVPQILPGGKAVLFSVFTAPPDVDRATIEIVTLADRRRKTIVRGAGAARYLPSGHLLYSNKSNLWAVPFDLGKLETRGTPVPVLDDLGYNVPLGVGGFDFSRTGTLVYRRGSGGSASGMTTIQWLDSSGKKTPLLAKPRAYQNVRPSPDGRQLAVTISEGSGSDVWVYNLQRDNMTKLTSGGGSYSNPVWRPDGKYAVFSGLNTGLYWTRADGATQPRALSQSKDLQFPWSFSPDGKRLAFIDVAGFPQIWTVAIEEQNGELKAGKPEQFFQSTNPELFPAFSPDGNWIAYASSNSGRLEIEVRAYPPPASGPGGKSQISNSGGQFPIWSRTSHDLFYLAGDTLMAVSYSVKGDSFVPDKPRVWAEKTGAMWFDLAPDGKRAWILTSAAGEAPRQDHEIVFLENFFDELRRKVPTGQ